MRTFTAICMAVAMTVAAVRIAVAAPPSSLDVRAKRVTFYSNRFIVQAEGDVHVRLPDGTMFSGNFFTMDLKLNRYVLAGDAHIDAGSVHEEGAAIAGYPDLDRTYFLTGGPTPDRWTYLGMDFAKPDKGRQQPGDAFFLPDVSQEHAFVIARSMVIIPKTNVIFHNARVYTAGVYVPLLTYVTTFAQNPNFSQNAFSGALGDLPIYTNGSARSLTGFHLRYDGRNKGYLSFDQHFVWDRDYIVLSINPLTQEERQTNLVGFKHFSPNVEGRIFSQLSTAQHFIYQPETASAYTNVNVVAAQAPFSFSLTADQFNTSLLTLPVGEQDEKSYEHPSDASIALRSYDAAIKNTPLHLQFRAGYGIAHDGYHCGQNAVCSDDPQLRQGYALDYFGADRTVITTIWNNFVGATVYTSPVYLNHSRTSSLSATFDKQRQSFSLPHRVTTDQGTLTYSHITGRTFAYYGGYSINHTGDDYGSRQDEFYPPSAPIIAPSGATYVTYSAFRGFSTARSLFTSLVYTPTPLFNTAIGLKRSYDFPAPIPGVFGNAPWQLTTEVRLRLARTVLIDVSRIDYFNFGGEKPSFNVQFSP